MLKLKSLLIYSAVFSKIANKLKIPVFQNMSWLLIAQIANYIFPLIILNYLVNTIGIDNYGLISFAQAFIGYFILIVDYGFNMSATKRIAVAENNQVQIRRVFYSTIYSKILLLIVSSLFYFVLILTNGKFSQNYFIYLTFYGMIFSSVFYPQWYFQGIQKMGYITVVNLLVKLLFLGSVFCFIRIQDDFIYLPILYSVSYLVPAMFAMYVAIKLNKLWVKPCRKDIVVAFKDGFPLFISSSMSTILSGSAVFILGLYQKTDAVGYFAGYDKIVRAFMYMFVPITTAIYPKVSSLFSSNYDEAVSFLRKVGFYVVGLSIISSILMIVFSDVIIKILFNSYFFAFKSILYVLSAWLVFSVLNNFLGVQYLVCSGKSKYYAFSITISGILTLIMLCFFSFYFSVIGTACAVLIGEVVLTLLMILFIYTDRR